MQRRVYLFAVVALTAGCGSGTTPTPGATSAPTFAASAAGTPASSPAMTASPSAPASPLATGTPLATATAAATATPLPTSSGLAKLPVIHERENAVPIAAGTYVTSAPGGFFPGLTITIPDGWGGLETDSGELRLANADFVDSSILLWKDLKPTVTNNREGKVGQPLTDVGSGAGDIIHWLTNLSDVKQLAKPQKLTVGEDISGTQFTLTTSPTADFAEPDCPVNPHCVALFTDTDHWGSGFYAIGGDEVARIFVAPVSLPDGDHTFYVALDSPNTDELDRFADAVQPIIDSLVLPTSYVDN